MNISSITDIVRKGYSHDDVVDNYSKAIEIWPEEESIFNKYFKNVGHILDIGCGAGRTSFYLAKLGNKITAIDLSPALIEVANARLKREPATIEFFIKDARVLDYPDNYFDGVIFSYNGIGHIPGEAEKIQLLKEIKRVLKPRKYFFFTAHNLWCLNQYFPGNIFRVLKIFFSKIFKTNIREKEYGEKYDDKLGVDVPYIDIKSRRKWWEIIKKAGLIIEYFNSLYGIKNKRRFSLAKDYWGESNFLFFVLNK